MRVGNARWGPLDLQGDRSVTLQPATEPRLGLVRLSPDRSRRRRVRADRTSKAPRPGADARPAAAHSGALPRGPSLGGAPSGHPTWLPARCARGLRLEPKTERSCAGTDQRHELDTELRTSLAARERSGLRGRRGHTCPSSEEPETQAGCPSADDGRSQTRPTWAPRQRTST